MQGTGEYFPHLQFHVLCVLGGPHNCGGRDRRYRHLSSLREFSPANSYAVTCMALKVKANDRRTSSPCHHVFRGPRSDYVRQVLGRGCARKLSISRVKIQSIHGDREKSRKSLSNSETLSLNSRVGSLSRPLSSLIGRCHIFAPESHNRNPIPLLRVNNRPALLISTPKRTCVQHQAFTRLVTFSLSVRLLLALPTVFSIEVGCVQVFCKDTICYSCAKSFPVDTPNARFWSLENPLKVLESQQDSSKLNVFCAISRRKMNRSFVFGEPTVTGSVYLDALQLCLFPQLKESEPDSFIW
ncbi:uncharacterized protein TNCV_5137641 [Trichonephila clavipes]|nr:uncharacterized protein TNCV_5137641 [Trichonephila clavipes]